MSKIKLYTGEYIDKKYFEETLSELSKEEWQRKEISELGFTHVNCMLSFETISSQTSEYFYKSNKGNIITEKAYEKYVRPLLS